MNFEHITPAYEHPITSLKKLLETVGYENNEKMLILIANLIEEYIDSNDYLIIAREEVKETPFDFW